MHREAQSLDLNLEGPALFSIVDGHLWINIHEDAKDAFTNFDGSGLCAYFGRHCCLHAGFWGLNGASIMASSVLMSRDLLHWLSSPCPGLSSPTLLYTLWSHWSFLLAHFFHIFIQGFPAFLELACLMSPSTHLWMFLPVTVLELKASAKALPQCMHVPMHGYSCLA